MMEKSTQCPVDAFLRLIGQRWSSYILWIMTLKGPIRFGALKREMPHISQKVLTEKLRQLEATGIIYRDYKNTIPPTVIYSLTPLGKEIIPILQLISDTAHTWREKGNI